jgi:hypothetical protein
MNLAKIRDEYSQALGAFETLGWFVSGLLNPLAD